MSGFRPREGIRHLPFFEIIASDAEGTPHAVAAKAGLLLLRLVEHWVLAGPTMVEPESNRVLSTRMAILAMPAADPTREALISIVNAMQTLREVQLEPILPRVAAYGMLLRRESWSAEMAADVDITVARLGGLDPPPPPDGRVREGSRPYGSIMLGEV